MTQTGIPDTPRQPEVGVVVLNWNSYEDTLQCIESLSSTEYSYLKIVVVDNDSVDGSGKRIETEFAEIEVVFSEENIGFAGGCNIGIEVLLSHGVDYVLLANNDMVFEPDTIKELVRAAEGNGRSLVSGVIKHMEKDEIWFAGGDFVPWKASTNQWSEPRDDDIYKTEFLTGALLLFPRSFLEQQGTLDEGYLYMHEDLEISQRARKNGWNLIVNPNAVAYHEVGASAGTDNPFSYYHNTRNRLKFASDHLELQYYIVALVFLFVSRLVRVVQWTLFGRHELTWAVLTGVHDYLRDARLKRPTAFEDR